MAGLAPTQRIAEWIAELPRSRTAAVAPLAIAGLRDAVGVMLAGAAEETPRRVAAAVARWGSGSSRVIGTGQALAAPWAALVNGAAAHVLDYDDTFNPLAGHATAVLVPAILAQGEERGAEGAALLDALVVGLEVMACIGRGVNPRHYALGWHATSTIGALGAAAACARLLRLGADQVRDALSLATSMASGSRMQLGAMAKSVHAGLAAKSGVLAASLAESGVEGTAEALAGRWRFAEMFAGGAASEAAMTPPAEGAALAIEAVGISYKAYPTCAATHLSLDALLALRVPPERIARIETALPAVLAGNLVHESPTSGMEARFSMQYCLATAAFQGQVALADFEGEAIHRPAIRALMPRITMQALPDAEPRPATSVTVHLTDGTHRSETRSIRRGAAENPMTQAEHLAKFRDCAARVLGPAQIEAALAALSVLAETGDATTLVTKLVPAA
ncbi:MmgE/PrpD family protein [Falsiroseomonas tokyonensis]|uniref:MmgE/PrpD family protein n=1 Tax=Falsiroseomonas tokyonensis TaxID=430521 RepID=A0ABV7BYU6_9PROT|nr:MmgE/PrpD family protein [Falsiroseomonas tokyonensis]MBU8539626.1 MmgE/PrpD family protein [Falsiroseomonas tokyonensis]